MEFNALQLLSPATPGAYNGESLYLRQATNCCAPCRGAIGHAVAYFILATSSINAAGSGFDPKPF